MGTLISACPTRPTAFWPRGASLPPSISKHPNDSVLRSLHSSVNLFLCQGRQLRRATAGAFYDLGDIGVGVFTMSTSVRNRDEWPPDLCPVECDPRSSVFSVQDRAQRRPFLWLRSICFPALHTSCCGKILVTVDFLRRFLLLPPPSHRAAIRSLLNPHTGLRAVPALKRTMPLKGAVKWHLQNFLLPAI